MTCIVPAHWSCSSRRRRPPQHLSSFPTRAPTDRLLRGRGYIASLAYAISDRMLRTYPSVCRLFDLCIFTEGQGQIRSMMLHACIKIQRYRFNLGLLRWLLFRSRQTNKGVVVTTARSPVRSSIPCTDASRGSRRTYWLDTLDRNSGTNLLLSICSTLVWSQIKCWYIKLNI